MHGLAQELMHGACGERERRAQIQTCALVDGPQNREYGHGKFAQFRGGATGFIPASYVDRAEALFAVLCATQRGTRLLHDRR